MSGGPIFAKWDSEITSWKLAGVIHDGAPGFVEGDGPGFVEQVRAIHADFDGTWLE